jgi:predicted RNA-binding Zn-ribbon protein involved in translation (DUF1610 family)
MKNSDHVIYDGNTGAFQCRHCCEILTMNLPAPLPIMASTSQVFLRLHKHCKKPKPGIESNAVFSEDRRYRYLLTRVWDKSLPALAMIGLNPSDANEKDDDRTSSKMIRLATKWGFGALIMGNLFAACSKDPKVMLKMEDPVGPDNDIWLHDIFTSSLKFPAFPEMKPKIAVVLAAWGNDGNHWCRADQVYRRQLNWKCLAVTNAGEPWHPLYLSEGLALHDYNRGTALRDRHAVVIHCPECGTQHIDEDEWATREHWTHECQSCWHVWKPYSYTTFGVKDVL